MTKKSKNKKVMTIQIPKAEAPPADAVETAIAALASMTISQGWAIIVKILNENIAYLEQAILDKFDPIIQRELNDAEVEILRMKRVLNIELRDTPANYAKFIKESGELPTDYDPYYKTHDDIIKAGKTPPSDDRGK